MDNSLYIYMILWIANHCTRKRILNWFNIFIEKKSNNGPDNVALHLNTFVQVFSINLYVRLFHQVLYYVLFDALNIKLLIQCIKYITIANFKKFNTFFKLLFVTTMITAEFLHKQNYLAHYHGYGITMIMLLPWLWYGTLCKI